MKNLFSGTQCGGINFHAVVVFGLGKNLLFKSVLGHCDQNKAEGYTVVIQRVFSSGLIIEKGSKYSFISMSQFDKMSPWEVFWEGHKNLKKKLPLCLDDAK